MRLFVLQSILKGVVGTMFLVGLSLTIIILVSGWEFGTSQFQQFWYYLVALAIGFGIQIGLYSYLKAMMHRQAMRGVVAATGTTSTLAMVSCCTHYLANIVPLIGISGVVSFVGQYQIQLFWIGLAFNAAGIAYIASKVTKARSHYEKV